MEKYEADYLYEVWRGGGNPDNVNLDHIPEDFDWVYDLPRMETIEERPLPEWERK